MIRVDNLDKVHNYDKVINNNYPSFSGIVSGECIGDLWVDDVNYPNIAIVYSYAVGSFAFLGNIKTAEEYSRLHGFLSNQLFSHLVKKGIGYFEFSIDNEELKKNILNMFADKVIQEEKEFSYRRSEEIRTIISLPEGYRIHKIDVSFWNEIVAGKIENSTFITKRILESWANIEDFNNKSLGFCIMHDGRIVSVIVGTARFNDTLAIDIETEESHRMKGLGFILTTKFVNECVKQGLTAQWDHVESNPESMKLAEKAGFKFLKQNEVYWFDL